MSLEYSFEDHRSTAYRLITDRIRNLVNDPEEGKYSVSERGILEGTEEWRPAGIPSVDVVVSRLLDGIPLIINTHAQIDQQALIAHGILVPTGDGGLGIAYERVSDGASAGISLSHQDFFNLLQWRPPHINGIAITNRSQMQCGALGRGNGHEGANAARLALTHLHRQVVEQYAAKRFGTINIDTLNKATHELSQLSAEGLYTLQTELLGGLAMSWPNMITGWHMSHDQLIPTYNHGENMAFLEADRTILLRHGIFEPETNKDVNLINAIASRCIDERTGPRQTLPRITVDMSLHFDYDYLIYEPTQDAVMPGMNMVHTGFVVGIFTNDHPDENLRRHSLKAAVAAQRARMINPNMVHAPNGYATGGVTAYLGEWHTLPTEAQMQLLTQLAGLNEEYLSVLQPWQNPHRDIPIHIEGTHEHSVVHIPAGPQSNLPFFVPEGTLSLSHREFLRRRKIPVYTI